LKLLKANPPEKPIPNGTIISGWTTNGKFVNGINIDQIIWNKTDADVELTVKYIPDKVQAEYLSCQVGGLAAIESADTVGCKYENKILLFFGND